MGLRKILTDKEPALHKVCKPESCISCWMI